MTVLQVAQLSNYTTATDASLGLLSSVFSIETFCLNGANNQYEPSSNDNVICIR